MNVHIVGWVEAVKADTHRQRSGDGYRCAQPILRSFPTKTTANIESAYGATAELIAEGPQ
jgi:hypothetical protein